MSEHEDRQRALDTCTWNASNEERELLRDCVAIPAAEYDMLRRALLHMVNRTHTGWTCDGCAEARKLAISIAAEMEGK